MKLFKRRKHEKKRKSLFEQGRGKKSAALAFATAGLICLFNFNGVKGTVSYLVTLSRDVINSFSESVVSCEINENFTGSEKTDVSVKNTGNTDAFIRAAVIVNWKDSEGKIYPVAPAEGTDYEISFNLGSGSGWSLGSDGFYYYSEAVPDGASTGVLITSCMPVAGRAPQGFGLSVDIAAEAVQAAPAGAAEYLWGVTVSEGRVTP